MSEEEIKELKEQLTNVKANIIRVLYFIAVGGSLTGVILMLAFPSYGSYWGGGVYVYVLGGFPPILGGAMLLLLCFIISLYGLIYPDRMKKKILLIGIFLPLLVFGLAFVGLAYAYSEFEGILWWVETGFYGSVIPGPIVAIILIIIFLSTRKS